MDNAPRDWVDTRVEPTSSCSIPRARHRQMSHRALLVRAVRTRRWPWFLLAGVGLVVGGVTLLSGVAQAVAAFLGVGVCLFALVEGIDSNDYYRPEPPVPPAGRGRVPWRPPGR